MNTPRIRKVKKKDISQLIELCAEHAAFEKVDYNLNKKADLLLKHLFSPENLIECLVVEQRKKLIGYISLLKQFSTWDASFYLYMDCLYLNEKYRGKGFGKMLMQEVKIYAQKENCNVQWQTPDFNTKAIDFYEALGAEHKTKKRFFWNVLA